MNRRTHSRHSSSSTEENNIIPVKDKAPTAPITTSLSSPGWNINEMDLR